MPELPEVQAHAERLAADYSGRVLKRFQPLTFTALKTASPPPDAAYGHAARRKSDGAASSSCSTSTRCSSQCT